MYRQAVDYYLNGYDNGSLPRYISETGQSQETGRDQGHAQLGLEAMADICEMAWTQGDDLWGALDNRLMKGFEYAARYNLGYGVPFKTWQAVGHLPKALRPLCEGEGAEDAIHKEGIGAAKQGGAQRGEP